MGDNAGTATVLLSDRSANDAYDLTIKFEFSGRHSKNCVRVWSATPE
jgi:hypothetical protein